MTAKSLCIWSLFLYAGPLGCGDPCPVGDAGDSDVQYDVGSGTASGVWQVTLSPSVSTTTCVDARPLPDEVYAYTLEFKQSADTVRARVLVEGYAFVEDGEFVDEGDLLYYQTDVREDADHDGGAITYRIVGDAALTDNGLGLVWSGTEQIRILTSDDPDIWAGCVFEYEVLGEKVCDE